MTARCLIVAALALALAGCARPTPYQPGWTGDGYGYGHQQLEDNRFRVTFFANEATPEDTVQNYLLYRAAEITLAEGGDWFIVTARSGTGDRIGGGERVSTSVGVAGGSRSGVGVGLGLGLPLGGGGVGGGPRTASAEIVVRRGPKPGDVADAFDARAVRQSLRGQIRRPGP